MRRNREFITKWITNLRSGKFKQTQRVLKQILGEGFAYCCLGVACELSINDKIPLWCKLAFTFNNTVLSTSLRKHIGLTSLEVSYLIDMNDNRGKNFLEIADYLENVILKTEPNPNED